MSTRPASTSAQALATIAHTCARHAILFTCEGKRACFSQPCPDMALRTILGNNVDGVQSYQLGAVQRGQPQLVVLGAVQAAVHRQAPTPPQKKLRGLSSHALAPRAGSARRWQKPYQVATTHHGVPVEGHGNAVKKRGKNCNQTHAGTDRARACVCRSEL